MGKKDYIDDWDDRHNKGRKYPDYSKDYGFGHPSNTSVPQYKWNVNINTQKESSEVEEQDREAISLLSDFIKFTYLPDLYDPTMKDYAYDIVDEAIDVLISKHEDYGPLNILNAPGGPHNGLAVRLHDKVSRLANLIKTGNEPNHESLRDTFIDIINYAVIGILVSEGHWE